MNLEEHAAKPLLAEAGIAVPKGAVCGDADAAARAAAWLGPCVVKAQVPAGKRGKAGGIRLAATPEEARIAAASILGLEIGGHAVNRVLVEQQVPIARELYAAVINDPASRGPLLLFSADGGMDIEEIAATRPDSLQRLPIDIEAGMEPARAQGLAAGMGNASAAVAATLVALYRLYRDCDAELLEINPLVITGDGHVMALDCKLVIDDAALPRRPDLAKLGTPEKLTELERRGRALGLRYIELEGPVGLLANGAGLTMTTMDAIAHAGGGAANFLEIGGDAYTQAQPALELVLSNPRVRSLVVNFCGAFARTDVMADGVVKAWKVLRPAIPVFFSIHGTGEEEAVALVRRELGIEPFDRMEDAVAAAVGAST
ncbi:MAG: acetate--CoA ligase family protein [Alphaproteobacteria bacterium]|nr:acetate--CoA ligase family protein [Alphaproteobacteria bacterium]